MRDVLNPAGVVSNNVLMRDSREIVDFTIYFGFVILRSQLDFFCKSAGALQRNRLDTH